jgi:hypothetical protein
MTTSDNQQALAVLIGLPLRTIGRAGNLLWLGLGEWREVPDHRGGARSVGQWAIHIQCDWGFSKSGSPIVSSADYYVNFNGSDLGDNWDVIGANRFDKRAAQLRAAFEVIPPRVVSIECDSVGGFSMHFDDISQLDVNPSEEISEEFWRLFEPGTDGPHFVVPPNTSN